MSLDPQTREVIEGLLSQHPVVLFMKGNRFQPQCGFSAKAVGALDMLVPEYLTVDVLQYPEIREGIKAYGNWPTVPQLYVRGELIGGSDIILEMYDSGELAEALGVEPAGDTAPRITVEPAAADIMVNALKANPGVAVHLKIDAGWNHQLSLNPPKPGQLTVQAGPVELAMDTLTAARADGLVIGVRESLQGQGFRFDNPKAPPPVQSLSVQELKALLDQGKPVQLFDVRSPEERAMAALPQGRILDEAAVETIDGLPKDTPLVFICHKGGRSRQAAESFRRRGYTHVSNVEGGIDAWSREIDPAMARY